MKRSTLDFAVSISTLTSFDLCRDSIQSIYDFHIEMLLIRVRLIHGVRYLSCKFVDFSSTH